MGFYEKFYKTFARPVRAMWRVEIAGAENIPEGGCILACNHTSLSDVIVVSAASNRQVRYMAKKELFKIPLLAPLIKALGAYPVSRAGADMKSFKKTISLIESGELIGMFPQGTRRPGVDPRETEVKGGVGMFAYHTKADVLPVFIDSKKMKTKIFHKNKVIFGPVIKYEELGLNGMGNAEYMKAAALVFEKICALKYSEGMEKDERKSKL